MPIYEYRCGECGHTLETIQKYSDNPLSECPACSEQSLVKLVSAASFRLKGGGWYETDFKTGDKKRLVENTSSESGSEKSAKSDKASDSKNTDTAKTVKSDKPEKKSATESAGSKN